MSSKWKRRAKRLESDRDEISAQRSQALTDLDAHAQEIDFLRTVVNEWVSTGAIVLGFPEDGSWSGRDGTGGELTPSLLEAVNRARSAVAEHHAALRQGRLSNSERLITAPPEAPPSQDTPGLGGAPLAIVGTSGAAFAASLGGVPLSELPPDAQARGQLRLAATRQILGPASPERDLTLLDEPDVNVSMADAAEVVGMVRDALLNRDRVLSLSALAHLLDTVLARIEYQAGCENDLYRRLHGEVLRDALTRAIANASGETGKSAARTLADAALAELKRQLPKLTGGAAAEL